MFLGYSTGFFHFMPRLPAVSPSCLYVVNPSYIDIINQRKNWILSLPLVHSWKVELLFPCFGNNKVKLVKFWLSFENLLLSVLFSSRWKLLKWLPWGVIVAVAFTSWISRAGFLIVSFVCSHYFPLAVLYKTLYFWPLSSLKVFNRLAITTANNFAIFNWKMASQSSTGEASWKISRKLK